jgi:uncharacterized protein (TIGR04255 family)
VVDFPQFALANFENPPVIETVLSLQFEKLAALQTVHLGLFWRKVRDRYPRTEDRPALAPVFERFPEQHHGGRVQFETSEILSLPRLLLLDDAGAELIQIQNDRFIKNWRKAAERHRYPHYEPVIRPAFERDLKEFEEFLAEEALGVLKVNQCEVTYVNHIVSGDGWEGFGEIHKIFKFWNRPPLATIGDPEDFSQHLRFSITDDHQQPIGRLHVDVQPAMRATDNRPMYVMNLTARGQYGTGSAFFDVGRKWIVKAFEELTTENMHRVWGRK